jgi:hypothetical protein
VASALQARLRFEKNNFSQMGSKRLVDFLNYCRFNSIIMVYVATYPLSTFFLLLELSQEMR